MSPVPCPLGWLVREVEVTKKKNYLSMKVCEVLVQNFSVVWPHIETLGPGLYCSDLV